MAKINSTYDKNITYNDDNISIIDINIIIIVIVIDNDNDDTSCNWEKNVLDFTHMHSHRN